MEHLPAKANTLIHKAQLLLNCVQGLFAGMGH